MAEAWPIVFLAVVLKVPAIGMIWLVLWAAKPLPEAEASDSDEDGGSKRDLLPFGPRRGGPHNGPGGPGDCAGGRGTHAGRSRQTVSGARSRERRRSREISRR